MMLPVMLQLTSLHLHIRRSLCPGRTFSGPGLDPCGRAPIIDRPSRPISINKLNNFFVIPLYFSMVNINDHGCSKKKKEEPCPFYVKDDGI